MARPFGTELVTNRIRRAPSYSFGSGAGDGNRRQAAR
jgi:hypothetical protein